MPDFDTDFCQDRRGEVIDYVMRKYGKDHVAQIVTFGTMAARAAIRDVGRVMNFTYAETDAVAKQIPATLHMTLDEALRVSPQLRSRCMRADERIKKLVDTARGARGHAPQHLDARRRRGHHGKSRSATMCRWRATTRPSSRSLP